MIVGCKVTLNKKNSYNFLEDLITFVLPNRKDFKGFYINSKSPSNLSFKIDNVLDFFELQNEFLTFSKIPNLNITIKMNSNSTEESKLLLNSLNFPIKK